MVWRPNFIVQAGKIARLMREFERWERVQLFILVHVHGYGLTRIGDGYSLWQ